MSIRAVRATRSWPDRVALPYERRETYAAALQQFEELIGAARVAGPASAPLPLFYALSQAGRAIAAAYLIERWELQGHGIQCSVDESSVASSVTKMKKEAAPSNPRQDSFRGVSEAIGSPVPEIRAAITLGEAFAAIESLSHIHSGEGSPLRIDGDHQIKDYNASSGVVLVMAEIPNDLKDVADLRTAMRTRLRSYPRGGALRVPAEEFLIKEPQKEGWIELFASIPNAPLLHEDREGWHAAADALLDDIAPRSPVPGDFRYLRAPIGGVVLQPLMAWWILLHGLSMLARYHPALWQQALDVDLSPDAVVLEAALEAAIEDVPILVSAALNREVPHPVRDTSDLETGSSAADADTGPSAS